MKTICLCAVLCLYGCSFDLPGGAARKQASARANVLSGAGVKAASELDVSQMTPVQVKTQMRSLLQAEDNEILQLDAAIRGTDKAAATRKLVQP